MVKNTTIWCRAFLIIISSLRVFLLDAQEVINRCKKDDVFIRHN
jgi:hypothetical protein